ncbi:hypothetical protein, partial [Streptomyces sp. NPDC002215]|uniref:hypothetical protein n=1 Tax=Streptomyces sp. NPDC002215 TaxID=3154412 RepID=UPI0033235A44
HPHTSHTTRYSHHTGPIRDFTKVHPDEPKSVAVYPAETIEAHRAFIARRRSTRPSEEYRTRPRRSGTPSSRTSRSARSPSAPALVPFQALVFMNTLAFVARFFGRTRPSAAAGPAPLLISVFLTSPRLRERATVITFEDVASHAAGMHGQPVGVRGFEIVPDRGAGREYVPATVIGVIEPAKIERGQGDSCDHLVGHEPQKRIESLPVTRTTTDVFVLVEDVIREVVVMNATAPVLGVRVDSLEVGHARDSLRVSVPLPGDHIQLVVVRPQLGEQRVMAFEEDAVLSLVVRVSRFDPGRL